jgi:hypothetical protein
MQGYYKKPWLSGLYYQAFMYEQPLHMQRNSSTSGLNATRVLQDGSHSITKADGLAMK